MLLKELLLITRLIAARQHRNDTTFNFIRSFFLWEEFFSYASQNIIKIKECKNLHKNMNKVVKAIE